MSITIDLPTVRHYTIYNMMGNEFKNNLIIIIDKLSYYGTIEFLQNEFGVGEIKSKILADIALVLTKQNLITN